MKVSLSNISLTQLFGGSVAPIGDTLAEAKGLYGFNLLRSDYSGNALKVERSSDGTTQDIGFNSDGTFDGDSLNTFVSGGTARLHTWFDQSGEGHDAVQTTDSLQPIIEQDANNYWHIKCEGADYVRSATFMGSQTNSSWYMLFQWPSDGTRSQVSGGLDFGPSTEFAGGPWTTNQSATTRAEAAAVEGIASRTWCDKKPILWHYKGLNGTESQYIAGALALDPDTRDSFPYSRITIGTNDFSGSDVKIYEIGAWAKDIDEGLVWAHCKDRFSAMWDQTNPYFVFGDSLTQTQFTGIPDIWLNDVVDTQSIEYCHAFVRGGWRLQDWIDKYTTHVTATLNNINFTGLKRAIIFAGTNDVALDGLTGAQCYAKFETLKDLLIADGFDVIGMTQLPRGTTSIDSERVAFNTSVKTDPDLLDVVELDGNANLTNAQNTTFFNPDFVHLTDLGQDEIRDEVNTILSGL